MGTLKRYCVVLLVMPCLFLLPVSAQTWLVRQRGTVVEAAYGSDPEFPQYAALHHEGGFPSVKV